MKYYETHFEDYLGSNERFDLHDTPSNSHKSKTSSSSTKHEDSNTISPIFLRNTLFYGPQGVGKYTKLLKTIQPFSPSKLKYEKKISIVYKKQTHYFKISDIHYEIDMSLLGCNAKLLWHEIYQQIIDILSTKTEKIGIIVCKNFHDIHNELLDNFYHYMTDLNGKTTIKIYYMILTEHLSFIPDNIVQACWIVHIPRPTKTKYIKCIHENSKLHSSQLLNHSFLHYSMSSSLSPCPSPSSSSSSTAIPSIPVPSPSLKNKTKFNHFLCSEKENISLKDISTKNISNIKSLYHIHEGNIEPQYKSICDKIILILEGNPKDIQFLKFRDYLYDFLVYNLNIFECISYIFFTLIERKKIQDHQMDEILIKTFVFFQYYNNNYRPIFHLEHYFLSIVQLIHGIPSSSAV